jgi:hypothetical protein
MFLNQQQYAGQRAMVHRAIPHVREAALLTLAYFAYMYTRALFFADVEEIAFANAQKVVDVEQKLGFFWEPVWQDWAFQSAQSTVLIFNWIYIFTFWPIIITSAVILYMANRRIYYHFRNVVLASFVVALLVFTLFPMAPPRMLPQFADTIADLGPAFYASRELANYYNVFASMPSLHFAWTMIFGYMFLTAGPWWLKPIGVTYPAITLLAITITGNHYILDAIGGAGVMVCSLAIMYLLEHRSYRRTSFSIFGFLGTPSQLQ